MEIRVPDFFLGLAVGFVLSMGLFWLASRVRAWMGRSEVGRLTKENRELKRRLTEKDRHVSRMMQEAERLAEKLAQDKAMAQSQGGEGAKRKTA